MFGQAKWLVTVLMMLVLVTGCGNSKDAVGTDEMPEMIKVQLMIPDKVSTEKPVALQIKLTQGGQPVDDADHVQFQIWDEQDPPQTSSPEQGMMSAEELEQQGAITAKAVGDGIYEAEYAFEQTGEYVVQAHVTAGAMHTMPRAKVSADGSAQ